MYDAVGRDYEWRDRFEQAEDDPETLAAFVSDPLVEMWVAYAAAGRRGSSCSTGARPGSATSPISAGARGGGRGLGGAAPDGDCQGMGAGGRSKMTVNTCTLDHPRALGLYRKMGFRPVRTEDRTRILCRDRDTSLHPA
jgi:hypothetical protein